MIVTPANNCGRIVFRISAAVILYNPSHAVIENIKSYLPFIDKLYAIDNSENQNFKIFQSLSKDSRAKISYKANKMNKGIGYALNQAVTYAISDGFDWLLTMDQDSLFVNRAMPYFIDKLPEAIATGPVGIFSANLIIENAINDILDNKIESLTTALTSGSLLNLKAYTVCGPFMSKFFIDQIDHEYSLRLRINNFIILRCNGAHVLHRLGETDVHKIFNKRVNVTHHDHVRRYYITRNRLAVCFQYFKNFPRYCLLLLWFSITDVFLIIFFEKKKLAKLRSMILGTKDFIVGKYGKYVYE